MIYRPLFEKSLAKTFPLFEKSLAKTFGLTQFVCFRKFSNFDLSGSQIVGTGVLDCPKKTNDYRK